MSKLQALKQASLPMKLLFAQLALLLLVGTWALGGRAAWAPMFLTIVCWSTLIPFGLYLQRGGGRSVRSQLWLFLPWLLLLVQLLLSLTNPAHEMQQVQNTVLLKRVAFSPWLPLTMLTEASLKYLGLFSGLLVLVFVLSQMFRSRRLLELLVKLMVCNAFLVVLLGAFFRITNDPQILGFVSWDGPRTFFGPFRYHGHYAAYGLLSLTLTVTLLLLCWRDGHRLFSRRSPLLVYAILGLLLVWSLILARSRLGLLLLALLLLFYGLLLLRALFKAREREERRSLFGIFFVGLLLACVIGWFSRENLASAYRNIYYKTRGQIERTGQTGGGMQRDKLWNATLEMISDRPYLGYGLGSYAYVSPHYYKLDLGKTFKIARFAHNDYLQLMVELGVVGFVLLILTPVLLFLRSWRRLAKHLLSRHLLLACALLSVYACVDLTLSNPSLLTHYCILLGALFGCAGAERVSRKQSARHD